MIMSAINARNWSGTEQQGSTVVMPLDALFLNLLHYFSILKEIVAKPGNLFHHSQ
jgi:hypothetical protein